MNVEIYKTGPMFVAACKTLGCFGSGATEGMARNALRVALVTKFGDNAPEIQ
jgi:hypothetical protein